jgi:hypothetical protein
VRGTRRKPKCRWVVDNDDQCVAAVQVTGLLGLARPCPHNAEDEEVAEEVDGDAQPLPHRRNRLRHPGTSQPSRLCASTACLDGAEQPRIPAEFVSRMKFVEPSGLMPVETWRVVTGECIDEDCGLASRTFMMCAVKEIAHSINLSSDRTDLKHQSTNPDSTTASTSKRRCERYS